MTASRTILVTGTSRGIGAVIAAELAARGHFVGCLSRKGEGPQNIPLTDEVRARLILLRGDVLEPASIATAFATLQDQAGPVSGLVNNAGIHLEGSAECQSISEFEDVLRTNTTAVFAVCQTAYPFLQLQAVG